MNMFGAHNRCMNIYAASNICMNICSMWKGQITLTLALGATMFLWDSCSRDFEKRHGKSTCLDMSRYIHVLNYRHISNSRYFDIYIHIYTYIYIYMYMSILYMCIHIYIHIYIYIHMCMHIYIYIPGSSARFACATAYRIVWLDYITE